ncbi:alpha/beta-hydrolase [Aspergillus affinis]|uniref:alpha/beta-hydrolase n=1 Tax=Aspergillus affinis TaxID=1070780 RepID=UPI0022FE7134|nr:alpha/beta-hydrolase [Aspergillus affinis]KAI9045268.1 alpha/beta-hydrolase [Aspergillus affinis]
MPNKSSKAFWQPVITELTTLRQTKDLAVPSFLTYDRFGQGQTTDRDPQDAVTEDPSHGHDCLSAVHDLHQLLVQLIPAKLGLPGPPDTDSDSDSLRLIFVANSLGCALARLYAAQYPGSTQTTLTSRPPSTCPPTVNVETLRAVRANTTRIFHPTAPNKESLSRKNLATLLPEASEPKLIGPAAQGGHPYVTVIGHDFDAFATESTKMGIPEALTNLYVNPAWERYNQDLVGITEPGFARGPVRATGAGHFIQKDQPGFVAGEMEGVLGRLGV